jgi:hypothetical protein
VTARKPRTRYTIGRDASLLTFLARILPDRILDRVFAAALRPHFHKEANEHHDSATASPVGRRSSPAWPAASVRRWMPRTIGNAPDRLILFDPGPTSDTYPTYSIMVARLPARPTTSTNIETADCRSEPFVPGHPRSQRDYATEQRTLC